ncbi:hypothetical protein ACFL96_14600 [Thermoproteota archaeon]
MRPKIEDILHALSNEYSIKIFKQTSTGLKSGKSGLEKTGLTKKQFYSKLNRLVDLGLVFKTKGVYKQTSLGTLVNSTQIKPLEEALINYWNLRAIDELKQSKVIPSQEQEKIAQSIINKNKYSIQDENQPSKILNTYDELTKEVIRLISLAENEIYIASRYYEPNISLKLMEKFREGVSLNILDGNPSGTSLTSRLKTALNDTSMRSIAKAMLESTKVRIRNRILEYSFIVVDGNYCGFEIINPLSPHEFNIAVEFNDQKISQKMINFFENLWLSSEIPIKSVESTQKRTKVSN